MNVMKTTSGSGLSTGGSVARIPLRDREGNARAYALVDAEDFERFGHLRWHLNTQGYAMRFAGGRLPNRRSLRLHREIMGLPPLRDDPLKRQVDHINRDPLDCRRENLRLATEAENHQNVHRPVYAGKPATSEHRGVSWDKRRHRWQAYGTKDKKRYPLGRFADELEAARVAAEWRRENLPYATS